MKNNGLNTSLLVSNLDIKISFPSAVDKGMSCRDIKAGAFDFRSHLILDGIYKVAEEGKLGADKLATTPNPTLRFIVVSFF